ncbi:TPA: hypothetical protein DDW35_02585 [Candidatus Sumerlaeota bacterium]|nr:hypothetical protein [Candidatus Sumerlaeota bacterium]
MFFIGPILFGLAFYAYSGAQPFLLLFWCWLAIIWRRYLWANKKMALLAMGVPVLTLLPTFYVMLRGGGSGMGRFNTLSVLKATDENGLLLPLAVRAFIFVKNYLSHFSPQFLFFTGDALPRHALPGFGVMLHIEMLFLIAGIYRAYRRRSSGDLLLLGWFLLMPFSAALTREGIPHALRTLHALPCPQILSAIGAVELMDWFRTKNKPILGKALIALTMLNVLAVAFSLFCVFPRRSAPWFEAGIAEAVKAAGAGRIAILSGGVQNGGNLPYYYELYHFHTKTDPVRLRDAQSVPEGGVFIAPPGTPPGRMLQTSADALLLSALDYHSGYAQILQENGWKVTPIFLPPDLLHPEPAEFLWVAKKTE